MKATELRLGDYVYSTFSNKPCKVIKLESSPEGYGSVCVDGVSGRKDVTSLTPIPLTAEILEKNGYERVPQPECANPYHWMMEKYEEESEGLLFRIKAFNNPFHGMFVSIDNPSACETISFGKQIKFVHELQHALRLCEIEKEVVL